MGFLDSFFGTGSFSSELLPEIFPLGMDQKQFVETDILNIYSKILVDCLERIQGIPPELVSLLWDNCLQSESEYGLITLLAWSMTEKRELFLVYNQALNVVRQATVPEASQIRDDYLKQGQSDLGVYVSFKNFRRTDIIRIYSAMEYCVIASLNKMTNLSKSIQFKMSEMRSSIGLSDANVAVDQAKNIAKALGAGRDVMMDKLDDIISGAPNLDPIKQSIEFLDCKRAFYLGLPISYITGEQTPGIGSTGEADMRAVERGLKNYYISILKPVLEALFGIETKFKSNDFRQIGSALEAIKTFELVGEDLISIEDKQTIIQRLLDIDPEVE